MIHIYYMNPISSETLDVRTITNGLNKNDVFFIQAAEHGNLDVLQLTRNFPSPYIVNEALLYAAYAGHVFVVEFLVNKGASISYRNEAALRFAAGKNHHPVVTFLLQHGAKATEAFRIAAFAGNTSAVQFLFSNVLDRNDLVLLQSAVQLASENGHLDIVKYLFANGAERINVPLRICF